MNQYDKQYFKDAVLGTQSSSSNLLTLLIITKYHGTEKTKNLCLNRRGGNLYLGEKVRQETSRLLHWSRPLPSGYALLPDH